MDISDCMTAEQIRIEEIDDKHLGILSFILDGWSLTKAELQKDLQPYW